MSSIELTVREDIGVTRKAELVHAGVPFKKGELNNLEHLHLANELGEAVPLQTVKLSTWPDGSARFVSCYFVTSVPANGRAIFHLKQDGSAKASVPLSEVVVTESGKHFTVDTGKAAFVISKERLYPLESFQDIKQKIAASSEIRFESCDGELSNEVEESVWLQKGRITAALRQKGVFRFKTGEVFCRFDATLRFTANSHFVEFSLRIHNPRAALHEGGFWDLGDPGSVRFKQMSLLVSTSSLTDSALKVEREKNWTSGELRIYQGSSGGENWQSPVHRNAQGVVPVRLKGYQTLQGNREIDRGARATPVAMIGSKGSNISLTTQHFWQNFPKALSVNQQQIQLDIFPADFDEFFELQGGESKTHKILIGVGPQDESIDGFQSPLTVSINYERWVNTSALPYAFNGPTEQGLQTLIDNAIQGPGNLLAKNELLDEYGWRNFGDIYADHEALGHEGKEVLVSHYNNQYDFLQGLNRQFIVSGDARWIRYAQSLAQHIADIDIYNTDRDRAEYSGGLFWHTDHYLDAATSSHRTYSKQHLEKNPASCGGGPGGEHCYASGLLYSYLLSGNHQYAEAVLTLSRWIEGFYEGNGGVFDWLYRTKSEFLPKALLTFKGRKPLAFKYPLDRGVGNYIKTLLDCFQLTGDRRYLDKGAQVIRNTAHPAEDISLRGLEDVENTWFFTIFLQAVAAFMKEKELLEDFDEDYVFARDTFLHYAKWIFENERPYLERPEILEYPNHAWVAQEIRRANILYIASLYATADKERFKQRAEEFFNYCIEELSNTETKTFTRMYAVLLQNHGPREYSLNHPGLEMLGPSINWQEEDTYLTRLGVLRTLCGDFFKRLFKLSLAREITWLCCRSKKVSDVFGRSVSRL